MKQIGRIEMYYYDIRDTLLRMMILFNKAIFLVEYIILFILYSEGCGK